MKYNFDEVINRLNTNCLKWDGLEERFGILDKDLLPLWVADMDFKSPQCVMDAIINRGIHGIFGYAGGYDTYYDAVIYWMKYRHNWDIKKEWIVFTPGVVPALNIILKALTNHGDKVIIQSPIYPPFFKSVKNNGCDVVDNPLKFDGTKYVMDFDDLEKKIDGKVKLMFLCSPHNPVGRVWSKEELKRLGEICIKNNIILVSDEIHADLVLKGHKHTPFASISEEFAQNTIVCTAPSKTFNIAGLQTSNIIITNEIIRNKFLKERESCGISKPNTFGIEALEAAYRHGEEWLDHLLVYLEQNLSYLTKYIEENIPNVNVIQPEATYLVWLDLRKLGLNKNDLENIIFNKGKLILNQGYTYGKEGEGFVRINIACPQSILKEGLSRLKKSIDNHL
ncbi:MalY/PatB family protein [Tepidibacter aestuarii]|uniref:MalY/PatB family protein n=1 Tax=Tepidibacter aestuarii TaxID=2925782 RepID=UPI0020BE6724|nr:MalY/PatB family protein [Tepidibacter aestuarii]CAH2214942.1 Cystathionine beta-lyase PatB [Tepidibacter aestuarii]